MPTNRNLSVLLAKMTAIFQKADPAQIEDLQDSINHEDARTGGDIWNSKPPLPETGPTERMSGDGVSPFVREYSDPSKQSLSGGDFAAIGDRLTSLEGTLKAFMGLMLKADLTDEEDERFPNSETSKDKTGKAEDEDDDDKESAKSDIAKMTVQDVFSLFSGKLTAKAERVAAAQAARDLTRSVYPGGPPNMLNPAGRAIQKAYHVEIADTLSDDNVMPLNERIAMRLRANVSLMRSQGADIPETDLRCRSFSQNF
jgi:hypothetical protein